ncbi:MAG: glycosyltransferase family 4 protein [Methanobacteriota archaeon]|nr:MAG: glycosyltransferase family 4 protein [Euryarchaeota archaeon]
MFPWRSSAPYSFVEELVEILHPICRSVTVVTGRPHGIKDEGHARILSPGLRMHYVSTSDCRALSSILWILKSLYFQLAAGVTLLRERKNLDILLFLAHPYESLPMICARIAGIRTIEVVTRGESSRDSILGRLAWFSERVSFSMCNTIAVEANSLRSTSSVKDHNDKVVGEAARYVDDGWINPRVPVKERKKSVAYIGRFRKEKGVIEFVRSIPAMVRLADTDVVIIGTGDLDDEVQRLLSGLTPDIRLRVRYIGWADRESLAQTLRSITVLVIPSQSEGLPTIALQAMASGAIVLATKTGGLNDLIIDGVNGFFIANRSADCIAEGVIRVFSTPNLSNVSELSRQTILDKYLLGHARQRYRALIERTLDR